MTSRATALASGLKTGKLMERKKGCRCGFVKVTGDFKETGFGFMLEFLNLKFSGEIKWDKPEKATLKVTCSLVVVVVEFEKEGEPP